MPTSPSDTQRQAQRSVLGCLLEEPRLWRDAGALTADDFSLDAHRRIWRTISELSAEDLAADLRTVAIKLADCVDVAYTSDLLTGVVTTNFPQYVAAVHKASQNSRWVRLCEKGMRAQDADERASILQKLQETHQDAKPQGSELIVIRGDEATEKPLRWMWKPYLPKGKHVTLSAIPVRQTVP